LNAKTLNYCEGFIVTASFVTIRQPPVDKPLKHAATEETEGPKSIETDNAAAVAVGTCIKMCDVSRCVMYQDV
jgi:hypothetical protein